MSASVDTVLRELLELPSRERLHVIAQVLPGVERELQRPSRLLESLCGLWKNLGFDIAADTMDGARREAWHGFPRNDI